MLTSGNPMCPTEKFAVIVYFVTFLGVVSCYFYFLCHIHLKCLPLHKSLSNIRQEVIKYMGLEFSLASVLEGYRPFIVMQFITREFSFITSQESWHQLLVRNGHYSGSFYRHTHFPHVCKFPRSPGNCWNFK